MAATLPDPTLPAQLRRWNNLLNSAFPLVSAWLQEHALNNLTSAARLGSSEAARILAVAAAGHTQAAVRSASLCGISSNLPPRAVTGIWQAWSDTRSTVLIDLLRSNKQLPVNQPRLTVLAALKLGQISPARRAAPDLIPFLLELRSDPDPEIRGNALEALRFLKRQPSIDRLCTLWAETREPSLAELIANRYQAENPPAVIVLTGLKFGRPEQVTSGNAAVITPLLAALHDRDSEIARQAAACLRGLANQDAVDELCRVWSTERSTALEDVIRQARYLPAKPRRLRLLVALLTGRAEIAKLADAEDIPLLLEYTRDQNPRISSGAANALHSLAKLASQSALCALVVSSDDSQAAEICRERGYLPEKPEDQALFHFYMLNWEELDCLDSGHRMLRAAYTAANTQERRRMAAWIQRSGQANLLDVLNPAIRQQTDQSAQEQTYLANLLLGSQAYAQALELAVHCSAALSAQIIQRLNETGYQPALAFREIYSRLLTLSASLPPYEQAAETVPAALPVARLTMRGRVNCLAFSPCGTHLAIGASSRLTAIWDYQQASLAQTVRGFQHSVGAVAYSPDGALWIGERGRSPGNFGLYRFESALEKTTQLAAAVVAIHPQPNGTVWAIGRDASLTCLRREPASIQTYALPAWPRALAISPDGASIAACERSVLLLDSAQPTIRRRFQVISSRYGNIRAGMISAAAFSASGDTLLIGQHNGQLIALDGVIKAARINVRLVAALRGKVSAILPDPARQRLIAGDAACQLALIQPEKCNPALLLPAPGAGNLTSLSIHPSGKFLAVGYAQNEWALWDLRSQDLPDILSAPIGSLPLSAAETVLTLENSPLISPALRAWLAYAGALLRHRFQYDIDIANLPAIKPGSHEILLDALD